MLDSDWNYFIDLSAIGFGSIIDRIAAMDTEGRHFACMWLCRHHRWRDGGLPLETDENRFAVIVAGEFAPSHFIDLAAASQTQKSKIQGNHEQSAATTTTTANISPAATTPHG
jgi:hypothetical protein